VIIGEERPKRKVLQKKTPRVAAKASTLGGQGGNKKANSKTTGLTGATGLTGVLTSLTGVSSEIGNFSKVKNRTRPSFKELLAKYEKERDAQKPKCCPSGLSRTQKRRLQRKQHKESVEQQVEVVPMKSPITRKVWRPKQVVLSSV